LPLLNTGTTAASFHAAGKYCWVKAQVEYMPKNRNKNIRTTFYDETRDIVKSDRFGRYWSLDGFADICVGNGCMG
jgi:hypothetical protein